MKKNRNTGRLGGFTLMEILVAMAILGILVSVGYASYTFSIQKSRDAQRKGNMDQLSKALESYLTDNGLYPGSCGDRIVGCDGGICAWGAAFTNNSKVYMKQLPQDPVSGQSYVYRTSDDRYSFQIYARLENDNDPEVTDYPTVTCSTNAGETTCNYTESSSNAATDVVYDPGVAQCP